MRISARTEHKVHFRVLAWEFDPARDIEPSDEKDDHIPF